MAPPCASAPAGDPEAQGVKGPAQKRARRSGALLLRQLPDLGVPFGLGDSRLLRALLRRGE
eukprot:9544467-Alexandrium_andersonii.AAC.1